MTKKVPTLAKRILVIIAASIALLLFAAIWYVNDYFRADGQALSAIADENGRSDGVEVRKLSNGDYAFIPNRAIAGLVFYPGAKVQPEAYAPLMEECAKQGLLCVLLKPTFNLAIIDMDAADGTFEQFPGIDSWIVAGHSMGGVAAADYAARHVGRFDGVVFLASYPACDLGDFDGKVLSIVGDNDRVLNRQKAQEARDNLPAGAQELIIDGGNHAFFGNYGEQPNDGDATISRAEQQTQTAEAIADLV